MEKDKPMYSTLADYYDQLVSDQEAYQKWAGWVEFAKPGKTFLELACGSGEITRLLSENHDMTALDLSSQMVKHARSKDAENKIRFLCADMTDLKGLGVYDAIGCFCDSINYLTEDAQMERFFKECAEHLAPCGLLFFDTHSIDRLEEFEDGYSEAGEFEDGTQVQWEISSQDDLIYQDFVFYHNSETILEHHLQRVYPPEVLEKWMEPWFEIIDVKTDFDLQGIALGEKYFYTARRKDIA